MDPAYARFNPGMDARSSHYDCGMDSQYFCQCACRYHGLDSLYTDCSSTALITALLFGLLGLVLICVCAYRFFQAWDAIFGGERVGHVCLAILFLGLGIVFIFSAVYSLIALPSILALFISCYS